MAYNRAGDGGYQSGYFGDAAWNIVMAYDRAGDGEYQLGYYDAAKTCRQNAYEYFEICVELEPEKAKYDDYFRNKVLESETW